MGLASILFVYLADEKWDKGSVYKSNILNGLILGFAGFAIIFLLAPFCQSMFNSGPELTKFIRIHSISLIFAVPFLTASSALIYADEIKTNVLILLITNFLKLILLVVSIQVIHSMEMIFWSMVFVSMVQLIWTNASVPKHLKKGLLQLKLGFAQIKDGFYLGFSKVLGVFLIYTDSFMISAMLSVEEYAIFRNGAIEIPFLTIVYGSVATIILPEVSKLFAKNKMEEIALMKKKASSHTAAIIYPPLIFLLLFSTPVISAYLSGKYAQSGTVFMIYNLIILFRINNYHDIITNSNKKHLLPRAYFVCLVGNAILNYMMIRNFGYIGAAISSVVSIVILLFYLAGLSAKIIGKNVTDIFNFPLLFRLLLPPLITGAILYIAYEFIFPFHAFLPFIGIIVVLFSYWFYWRKKWIERYLVINMVVKIPLIGGKLGRIFG